MDALVDPDSELEDYSHEHAKSVDTVEEEQTEEYQTVQSFGTHYNESMVEDSEEGTVSEYTVLIYLNGECDSDLL
ncbi:hypothetical protein BGZ74_006477, partial [Mortierella antarctica]